MRTCVYHDGALGDAVLSLPCVRGIARGAGSVEWIGRGDVGRMLTALGIVHASHDAGGSRFARWHAPNSDSGAPDLLDLCGRLFLFTARPDSDLARNIRARSPEARVIVTVPPAGERTHVAEYRLRQLPPALRYDGWGALAVPAGLVSQAHAGLARAGYRGRGGVITLHPGSGGKSKCWPLERYFALAERLASRFSAFILFLGGPVEAGVTGERIEGFVRGKAGMGCVADSELPVVAALLAGSRTFIGNDSGITHLAAAVGVPVVALFGPTDPALWAPRGARVQVVASSAMEDIAVDAVLEAVERAVPRPAPS